LAITFRNHVAQALTIIAGVCCLTTAGKAQVADLNVSPKRLVLEQTGRAAAVYIFNRGARTATYALSLDDKVMTPDGRIRALDEATTAQGGPAAAARARSARSMIVFTPHRIVLGGGSSQVVRLQVLRPLDLPAGEYRAHLTVRELPPEAAGLTADQAAANENGSLSVNITTLLAISIPVIVRQGPTDVRAGVEDVRYSVGDGAPGRVATISLQLVRAGASSLFGDVEIRRLVGGKPGELVGALRGVGVYPEVDRRTVEVALTRIPQPGARLAIVFRPGDAQPGEALATTLLTVPS
jgi:hypothetical protein